MDKWQKYIAESKKKKKGTFGDELQSDMDDFLKKGSKKAAKGSPFRGSSYNFRGKNKNQISAPPGAAGGLEEEVEPESFEKHDELNPTFWFADKLDIKIARRLEKIARDFLEGIEFDVDMKDLRFTGSLANYNWSKYSDVDLHIVADFSEIDDDVDMVKSFFDAVRMRWNDTHDIKIHGYEVELYVENVGDVHKSSGIYSIPNEEWVAEPDPASVDIDIHLARKKSDNIATQVNLLQHVLDKGKYQAVLKSVERIKEKIRRMRQAGLDSPAQEFSPENIAFKILRREEVLQKLNDLKYDAYDELMSVK